MDVIYVLRLKNEKWYVGRTSSLDRRYEQHVKGEGSKWTFLHQPLNIHETRELKSDDDEDLVTLEYMKQHGIYNVRGGGFCAVELKPWVVTKIKEKIGMKEVAEVVKEVTPIPTPIPDTKKEEESDKKFNEVANKVSNEFFNPNSDLRSGRWFKKTFGF